MSTSSAPRLANTVYIDWLKSRIADKLISNKQNENEDEDDDEDLRDACDEYIILLKNITFEKIPYIES